MVETIRSVNGTGRGEAEIRYFLTSCNDDPAVLVRAIRRHWSIERVLPLFACCWICLGSMEDASTKEFEACSAVHRPL